MKKNLLYGILFLLMFSFVTSCDETIHFYPEPQSSLVILQLNVDRDPPTLYKRVVYDEKWQQSETFLDETTSIPYDVSDDYLLRITVEVHRASLSKSSHSRYATSSTLVSRRVVYVDRDAEMPQDTLHYYLKDGEYFAAAWVDYVPADDPRDWHFDTSDINDIVMIPDTYPTNPHLRSSACGSVGFVVDFSLTPDGFPSTAEAAETPIIDRTISLNMQRVAGRYRIIATDRNRCPEDLSTTSVKVVYSQFVSTGYSPVRDEITEIIGSYSWSAPLYIENYSLGGCAPTDLSLVTDYLFANPNRESRIVADFYFYDKSGRCFNQCSGVEIPIFSNRETIVLGDFLTSSPDQKEGDSGVSIDEGFDGEIVVVV